MQSIAELAPPTSERSPNDLLKRAMAMALELEQLLRDQQAVEQHEGYRLRLARAHSLSVVDALTELVCRSQTSESVPPQSGVYAVTEWVRGD
jgi:hypothetical protein